MEASQQPYRGEANSDDEAELSGRVVLGDLRLAPAKFSVHCIPAEGDPAAISGNKTRLGRTEKSGPSGRFRFMGLPIGEARLLVTAGRSSEPLAEASLVLQPGPNTMDLRVGYVDFSRYLLLRCLDPQGSPAQAERVAFRATHETGSFSGGAALLPLADGSQLVALPPNWMRPAPGEKPWEQLLLTVSHPVYSNSSLWLRRGQGEAAIQFMEPGDLHVRLDDVPDALERLVRVLVEPISQRGHSFVTRGLKRGKDGVFRFSKLEAGENRVKIYVLDGHGTNPFKRTQVSVHPVWISPGVQELSFPFPRLHEVTVRRPVGLPGTEITLWRDAEDVEFHGHLRRSQQISGRGTLRFRDIPAGKYVVGYGSQKFPISVPCGEVVLDE